jgi:hypothetical protein
MEELDQHIRHEVLEAPPTPSTKKKNRKKGKKGKEKGRRKG